jgi:hypothetical protein
MKIASISAATVNGRFVVRTTDAGATDISEAHNGPYQSPRADVRQSGKRRRKSRGNLASVSQR